jgi:F420 biosynthesis protein FbiB-like protein
MNDVLENLYTRRSVRSYKPTDVPDDVIRELIKAGTYAPSAHNFQPWRFVVIKNREMIARLSERAKKVGLDLLGESSDPNAQMFINILKTRPNIFYDASVLILIFSERISSDQGAFAATWNIMLIDSCAAAAQNMMLAARSLGIGSCWIGFGMPLDSDQEIRQELNVPEEYSLMAPLIFGYPAKDVETAPPRNEDVILKWIP